MRYGEDVISRIAQADGGLRQELAAAARDGVNETLARLCARQDIEPRHIYDLTVVGNTAMHHLALGVPAQGLGEAPYAPVVATPLLLRAADLGLEVNPEAGVYLPPPIAGFVGSDSLAVAAATHLALKRKPAMAIDIGTNTEISLCRGRQGHGDELRLRPRLRGLPDPARHEGGRGGHREGDHSRRRPARRRSRRSPARRRVASAARVWSTCSPGWCAAASSTAAAACRSTRGCARAPAAASTCSPEGPTARSSSPSTTCAPCSSPRRPSRAGWALLLAELGVGVADLSTCTSPGPSATTSTWTRRRSWACSRRCPRARRFRRQRGRRRRPDGAHRRARAAEHGAPARAHRLPGAGHRQRVPWPPSATG